MCNTGYNVEDSLIMSKGAIDRGLFNCCKFTFYKTELEQKEEFGIPDINKTAEIKSANYSKLNERGMISRGMTVEKNDVIIGKFIHYSKSSNPQHIYTDYSVVYKDAEPAIVHDVIEAFNEDNKYICKVVLRKPRPIVIGDKFSNRSAQKGICALQMRDSDMPYTQEGLVPSVIFNPHGMPTRMTVSQLLEMLIGNCCTQRGATTDATIFYKCDVERVADELEKNGFNRHGTFKMYNGITGEYIDEAIFMGMVYYQRLQKFVADAAYGVSSGPIDAITRQPLARKSAGGGLRLGEMERDVLASHGVMKTLVEKYTDHSDGFTIYVCANCGNPAIVNEARKIYKCKICADNANIVKVLSTWSSNLFLTEVRSMNIGVKTVPRPQLFEHYE